MVERSSKEKGRRKGKEAGGEGRWGWVGGISLGEWCYTTVCACNTNNLLLFLFSISLSPLPSFQGWLCDVESMMHVTLKDILRACRIDLKKHLNKRDKWIRDWPGQVGKETNSFKTLFFTLIAHLTLLVTAASDRSWVVGAWVKVVVSMKSRFI